MKRLLLLLTLVALWSYLRADVRPARVFADHMVLQRGQPVPVWGWAKPGEKITLTFNGQTLRTQAAKDSTWRIDLAPMQAGGPFTMTLAGKKNTVTLQDILIGEVWICSGQSNMEWPLSQTRDAEAEIAAANYPQIRQLYVRHEIAMSPRKDLPDGAWTACSPQTAGAFTAVGYFFARKLQQELGVPIGLINTNWGGTEVETWISGTVITGIKGFENVTDGLNAASMDALLKERRAFYEDLIGQFGPVEEDMVGNQPRWADPALDVSKWKNMVLPDAWENAGLANVDGVVWFRKEFTVSAEEAARGGMLHLGPIDDSDITWVNGKQVGETRAQWNKPREYAIAPGVLKAGKNVIAVRVEDTGGGGGIYNAGVEMKWVSGATRLSLAGEWRYRVAPVSRTYANANIGPNEKPTLLYNAMIAPIIPYAIQGAIWYQGESNAGRAYEYRTLFPAMIRDWRSRWNREFPFLWVQLANFHDAKAQPGESDWAELREAQSMTLSLPATGQAVITDIGEANDIHPRNKQDVGLRLALAGLKVAYGKTLVYSGPVYRSMQVQGSKIMLEFDNVGSGLIAQRDRYGYLKGFSIAGADRRFVWAKAEIQGNKIVVWSDAVAQPLAVRYAWADNPDDANLYNKEGLPASPFRTDTWDGITKDAHRTYK